jgi:hypothetical protein
MLGAAARGADAARIKGRGDGTGGFGAGGLYLVDDGQNIGGEGFGHGGIGSGTILLRAKLVRFAVLALQL